MSEDKGGIGPLQRLSLCVGMTSPDTLRDVMAGISTKAGCHWLLTLSLQEAMFLLPSGMNTVELITYLHAAKNSLVKVRLTLLKLLANFLEDSEP